MRSLSALPVAAMDLMVVTNNVRQRDLTSLRGLCGDMRSGKSASIRSYGELDHLHYLTWCHKEIIANEFVKGNQDRYSHFIY
jgi:hypothetical protein